MRIIAVAMLGTVMVGEALSLVVLTQRSGLISVLVVGISVAANSSLVLLSRWRERLLAWGMTAGLSFAATGGWFLLITFLRATAFD